MSIQEQVLTTMNLMRRFPDQQVVLEKKDLRKSAESLIVAHINEGCTKK